MSGSPATIRYCAALALEEGGSFVRSLLLLARRGPEESTREAVTVLRQLCSEGGVMDCVVRWNGSVLVEDRVEAVRRAKHHATHAPSSAVTIT